MQRNTKLFLGFLIWIIVFIFLLFLWLRPYKYGPREFDMLLKNTQKIVVSDAVTEKVLETIMGEDEIRAFMESCQITDWL